MLKLVHEGNDDGSIWVTKAAFCSHYSIPARTIGDYIQKEIIKSVRVEDGIYHLHLIRAHDEYRLHRDKAKKAKKKKETSRKEISDREATKLESEKIKNALLKMELEQKRELLVARSAVEMIETKYLSNFKALMRQAPAQWARRTGVDEKVHEQLVDDLINQLESLLETKKKMYADILQTPLSFNPF